MKKGRQDRIAETLTIYLSNKGSPFTFSFSIINSWMKVKGDFFSMKWGKKRNPPHEMQRIRDRDRIQTCNRLIRSQLLYSVELRDHYFVLTGAKIRTFPELASFSTTFFVENYSMNR